MDLKGYQQYKEQSIATMTQEELLLLLYDELVKRLVQAELLNGAAAVGKEEERLAEQVALNGRLLKQIVELDRILNQKLGGEKSLYHKKLDTGPSG